MSGLGAWYCVCCWAHQGLSVLITYAQVFSCMYCWFLIFVFSAFCVLIFMYQEIIHGYVRDMSCEPSINVSWSTSALRVKLVLWNMFKPSSNFLTDRSKAVLLLWIHFVISVSCLSLSYCLVCFLQPCGHLLGKGWPLGSLVRHVYLRFCHFPIWCPG